MKASRLNCYIAAWQAYAKGDAIWMACRQSCFSLLQGKMPLPVRLLGALIIWPSAALWLIGHFLTFGTWPHWAYCTQLYGDCMEYAPTENKSRHAFPPIFFVGERRSVGERRQSDRRSHPHAENPTYPDSADG